MDYSLGTVRALLRSLYNSPRSLEECDERADLVAGLLKLRPADRKLLYLRAAGYSYREIALMLGIKRADSRVKQAERRLVAVLSA